MSLDPELNFELVSEHHATTSIRLFWGQTTVSRRTQLSLRPPILASYSFAATQADAGL